MDQAELNMQLDGVVDEIETGRLHATPEVLAWLDHAINNRLGLDVSGFSRQDYEDLRLDLLEVFLAGVITERMGWTVVDEP